MQDIPRNELLEKLAAGWKVRRKKWSDGDLFGTEICRSVSAKQLLEDDWEGEPPELKLLSANCTITYAFGHLQRGSAKFVRRAIWAPGQHYPRETLTLHISPESLLATDWEVWG